KIAKGDSSTSFLFLVYAILCACLCWYLSASEGQAGAKIAKGKNAGTRGHGEGERGGHGDTERLFLAYSAPACAGTADRSLREAQIS
ncbi:MAG: hypothetical protein KAU10_07370, partial [Dehalococcoidia bacterium]|nr:hypothetical protein [Dehalococcoidia bacterium]